MGKIVEYEVKGGGSILVEERESDIDTEVIEEAGFFDRFKVEKAKVPFDTAIEGIEPAARAVLEKLQDLGPQSIAVEFGFNLKGGVKAVLAEASMEANFKVTLNWNNLGSNV